jgi:hypothetical protein
MNSVDQGGFVIFRLIEWDLLNIEMCPHWYTLIVFDTWIILLYLNRIKLNYKFHIIQWILCEFFFFSKNEPLNHTFTYL